MSLWKVNDETTRALMEDYYHHLLAGQGRATAPRKAMRELRRTQPHPHYWAPFIAMGRDTPLRLPSERGACPSDVALPHFVWFSSSELHEGTSSPAIFKRCRSQGAARPPIFGKRS